MVERFRQADLLQIHQVADGYVVRHPPTGGVHHLNQTAALLLELCDGRATAEEILTKVGAMFSLTPAQLRSVRSALDTLRRNGLVVAQSAPEVRPASKRRPAPKKRVKAARRVAARKTRAK